MPKLKLYSIYHLNLAFSSIPRDDYARLIRDCYAPILELSEKGIPVGIEATAATLIEIKRIDEGFIDKLASLCRSGKAEFIGSGFSQLIMPLAPVEVNRWNLAIAGKYYAELLGFKPKTALVNEQTFSGGLVDLYLEAGYETLVMDWNNSARYNEYPKEYLYYPQRSSGKSASINVLWSHSIAFQKFQRYIHGIISIDEYMDFIDARKVAAAGTISGTSTPGFPLYGNDAEVFDFRPGGNLPAGGIGEWAKISSLYERFKQDESVELVLPSDFVRDSSLSPNPSAFNAVKLTSPETPLPCKKQSKYNPTRWAVTGRDSVHVNTQCHKALANLQSLEGSLSVAVMDGLRERLCLLWGSDFRTNTTDEKFKEFQNLMGWLIIETERLLASTTGDRSQKPETGEGKDYARAQITSAGNILSVEYPGLRVQFLLNKGLSIKSLVFPELTEEPVIGTLAHGYFDDIQLGADFFSGHLINVQRDGRKVTDLSHVEPEICDEGESVTVSARIPLEIGILEKVYTLHKDTPRLDLSYRLKLDGLAASSLRLGIFTFFPTAFSRNSLWYESVNGGEEAERFYLAGKSVTHDEPVSSTVSASSCLGATDGSVIIGDGEVAVKVSSDKSRLFSAPLLHYLETDDIYFLRLSHSIGEIDDTAYWVWRGVNRIDFTVEPLLERDK